MIALILYLSLGVGLLVLLTVLALRKHTPVEGSAHLFVEARGSLLTLQQGLLPSDLIHRIFDRRDLDYVTLKMPVEIQRLFLAERKLISVQWVRRVRLELCNLMHFHRGHSRFHSEISVLTELRLASYFAALLVACRFLEAIFHFRGPYAAPRMVKATASAAARLCTTSEESMSFLNAANLRPFAEDSKGGNATI